MKISMAYLSATVSALVLALSTPVMAHLMVAGHGTLNIVNNNVFMVLSLPLSAFEGIDDNADGEIDLTEFNRHQAAIIKSLKQHVVLREHNRKRPLEDIILSPEKPHDHHGHHDSNGHDHDQVSEVIVMGRFALDKIRSPLSFHIGLFDKTKPSQSLSITASRKAENLRHEFQLTPEQPTGLLFPPKNSH
ncbi:hypothetical protein [Oceanospirillum maris]|uniref:hypothetical protein n=1 Tax=Oceanospirillum maris TaxID=64977 RepID=UPI000429FC0D|nr:hypothetical protein [Oceanospirillum maris]